MCDETLSNSVSNNDNGNSNSNQNSNLGTNSQVNPMQAVQTTSLSTKMEFAEKEEKKASTESKDGD